MAVPYRVLAVAASTGRVAYVYLEDNLPTQWGMSRVATKTTEKAAEIVQQWIEDLAPDLMVSENPKTASRKGDLARASLRTIADLFEKADGLNLQLTRHQSYRNKYEEAKALAKTYPNMKRLAPKQPPIWMPEPRAMSYFEALSLVQQIKANPAG